MYIFSLNHALHFSIVNLFFMTWFALSMIIEIILSHDSVSNLRGRSLGKVSLIYAPKTDWDCWAFNMVPGVSQSHLLGVSFIQRASSNWTELRVLASKDEASLGGWYWTGRGDFGIFAVGYWLNVDDGTITGIVNSAIVKLRLFILEVFCWAVLN